MSKRVVMLSYKHDEGDTCTGDILLTGDPTTAQPFERVLYRRMLKSLAVFVEKCGAEEIIIRRTDHPELFPMQLDEATVALAKTDIVGFIHALCYNNDQPIVIDLNKVREAKARKEEAVPRVTGVLLGGYDTLADAIGDFVFCRLSEQTVECALCGRWHKASASHKTKDIDHLSVMCPEENLSITYTVKGKWALAGVAQLLNLPMTRYYLPRPWNPSLGWISKKDLTELYRSSLQERRNA